jgi:protoheme IX farnesyltransferase
MALARDLVELTKPRITAMVLVTTGGGMALAEGPCDVGLVLATITGTGLAVASAGVLNCWLERDTDRLMSRTRARPLADGRVAPGLGLGFGLGLGVVSMPILWLGATPFAAALALAALVSYVAVYTPMKRRSPDALVVGAIPGALPPLIGGAAVTGGVDAGAAALAGILFFWQLPHFLAIALRRRDEYAAAGLKVVPVVLGERAARVRAVIYAVALLAVSLCAAPLGVAGLLYIPVAAISGGAFVAIAARGLIARGGDERLFRASLLHLVVLTVALAAL